MTTNRADEAADNSAATIPHTSVPKAGHEHHRTPLRHTLCSQFAGGLSTFAFYPLDVVKMRFMSQDGTKERQHNHTVYRSMRSSIRTIYSEEGLVALYRGVHVAVLGSSGAWGAYMLLYRHAQNYLSSDPASFQLKAAVSLWASATSAILTNPIWLVKTRMQLEETHRLTMATDAAAAHHAGGRVYRSFGGSVLHIVRTEGLRGLWTGSCAQVLLGIPNSLNFPIYETIKALRLKQTGRSSLDTWEVLTCSTATRTILMMLSHPVFVLKTRLQDQRALHGDVQYRGLRQALQMTLKREGIRGMYRGAVPSLAQAVPRSVLNFVVYEWLLHAKWLA